MKISVITVCYNSESSIGRTLASVAAQTHLDVEHIIVDGGSTDNTMGIVNAQRVRVARSISEPDKGIYDAMNKGLDLATGDLIGFLNADDVFATKDTLAQLARSAEEVDADVVYGDLLYLRSDPMNTVLRRWRSGKFTRGQLRFGWMPPHPTFYFRGRRLAEIGRFDSRMKIAADYDFMLRCLVLNKVRVAYVSRTLVHMQTGGVSNRSIRNMIQKSQEDLLALRRNCVGGLFTLACKNLRKIPQFLR